MLTLYLWDDGFSFKAFRMSMDINWTTWSDGRRINFLFTWKPDLETTCEVRICSYSIGTYFTFFLRLKFFRTFGKFSIRSALTDDNWKDCGTCLANIYYPSTHYYPSTTQLRILTKHTIYWNNVLCRPTLVAFMINRLVVVGPII